MSRRLQADRPSEGPARSEARSADSARAKSGIRHKHVAWREGRPRFSPGPELRAEGLKGTDLRWPEPPPQGWKPETLKPGERNCGRWFSRGECVDWSEAFQLERRRRRAAADRKAGGKLARAPGRAPYTVAMMLRDWQASPKWQLPRAQGGYSEATRNDYRWKLAIVEDDHPLIWNAPAAAVDRTHLRAMFEEIWIGRPKQDARGELRARGLASARGAVLALSAGYAWALLRGKVRRPDNPAYKLKMQKPAPRVRFGTRPEIEALVAAADRIGRPDWGDMILLAVWTGQRQGDRVELRHKGLLAGRRHFRQGKTGAIVAVLQSPILEARLKAAAERRRAVRAEALLAARTAEERQRVEDRMAHVVLDESRWVPYSGDHWSRCYAELRGIVAEGVPGDVEGDWKVKPVPTVATLWDLDFRDTSVTWMALAGATIAEICAVTGHELDTATQVLKHYLARHPEMADEALRKMVAWYDAGGETEFGL